MIKLRFSKITHKLDIYIGRNLKEKFEYFSMDIIELRI